MADFKITDLTAATLIADTDLLEISQDAGGGTFVSKKIAAALLNPTICKDVACSDEITALTAGLKVTFRWKGRPITQGLKISASVTTAQASGATLLTLDVKKNATTMFSTKPTFDNTEKTTETAATPAVLTATGIAYDDEITCHVDTLQAGSVAAGLKIYIEGKA